MRIVLFMALSLGGHSGLDLCAQEHHFSPGVVYDAGFNGHTWVANSDILAFDAVSVYESLDRFLAHMGYICTNAVLIKQESISLDPSAIRWSASQRQVDPEAQRVIGREYASLDALTRTQLMEFLQILDLVYGQATQHGEMRCIALELARAEPVRELWPAYEDPLRKWRGGATHAWAVSAVSTERLVESIYDSLAIANSSVRGRLWMLLREAWRNRESVSGVRDLRIQNMIGLLLVVRSIEREGLVRGTPIGGEGRGQESAQTLLVSLSREELDCANAFAVAVEDGLARLRKMSPNHVLPVQHHALELAETEGRLMTLRRTLAAFGEAHRRCEMAGSRVIHLDEHDSLFRQLAGRRVEPIGLEARELNLSVRPKLTGGGTRPLEDVVAAISAPGATRLRVDDHLCRVFTLPVSAKGGRRTIAELWR